MKRFYKEVATCRGKAGFSVLLDGKPIRSPARNRIVLPTAAMADVVVEEWRQQVDEIDFASMPLLRLVNITVDDVATRPQEIIDAMVAYGDTDLTCYRAEQPADLAARQHRTWQPLLDWIADRHDVILDVTAGIAPLRQSARSLAALRMAVTTEDPYQLTGTHAATKICGSVVIALAFRDREIGVDAAWDAAHLDEMYQVERWGEDQEAADRRRHMRAELDAADHILRLREKN